MRALALLALLAGMSAGQWRPVGLGPRPPSGSQTLLDWQPSAPAALSVASDTIVLWRMDTDGGAPVDAAGTVTGLSVTDVVGSAVGVFDGAEYWRGDYRAGSGVNADCASGTSPAALNTTLLGAYTVEFWLQRTSPRFTASYETPITVSDNATNFARALLILYDTSSYRPVIQWMTAAATYETHTATNGVPLGGWHHYAATVAVTGATRTLVWYVDGVATDTWTGLTAPNVSSGSTQNIFLGCGEGLNNGLAGSLDEFRITSRALSAAEVLADYRRSGRWSSPPPSTVGPSLALSRASTATYETAAGHIVNALSGELRCGYSGCPDEPSRTNRITQSAALDAWSKTQGGGASAISITANQRGAPDGTFAADKLDLPSVGSGQYAIVGQTGFTLTSAGFTWSIYGQTASGSVSAYLYAYDTTSGAYLGNRLCAWTTTESRCALTVTGTAGHGVNVWLGADCSGGSGMSPTSAGTVYAWGGQLEDGLYATSYIPTTTTAVTRAADVLSVSATGLVSAAGGIYLGITPEWASASAPTLKLISSNAAGEADLSLSSGVLTWSAHAGTVTSASLGWSASTSHTVSTRWTASAASLVTDSTTVTGTGGTPSISTLYLGGSSTVGAGAAISRVKVCKGRGCP